MGVLRLIPVVFLIISTAASADGRKTLGNWPDDSATGDTAPKPRERTVQERLDETTDASALVRKGSTAHVLLAFSPFDLVLPFKYGIAAGWMSDPNTALELDYVRSSVKLPFLIDDLGSITDERLAFVWRQFSSAGNFNFSLGLTYFRFKAHLGPQFVGAAAGTPGVDLIDQRTLGLQASLGHRWYFSKNGAFGVDWISLAQPLVTLDQKSVILDQTTAGNGREEAESTLKIFRYFPRFVFLKLQLGFAF
jgi:hypothetical protein